MGRPWCLLIAKFFCFSGLVPHGHGVELLGYGAKHFIVYIYAFFSFFGYFFLYFLFFYFSFVFFYTNYKNNKN